MFKVLPQMHRLTSQVCEKYGLDIAAVILDNELAGAPGTHSPYYICKLAPNPWGYDYISCRPFKGGRGDHSASINNVTVVLISAAGGGPIYEVVPPWRGYLVPAGGPIYEVVPSWRGYLVPADKFRENHYYVKRGYMLLSVGADYVEQTAINAFEGRRVI